VVRDEAGLVLAAETLGDLSRSADDLPARTIASYEVIDVLRVARAIVSVATARAESRGAHWRRDFAETSDVFRGRFVVRSSGSPTFVALREVEVGEAR
jgi:succinate dehydrogenase/fumarate reductase flavoprotein subunit